MKTLKSYQTSDNIALAKTYLEMNGITRATIDRGSLGVGWAVWLGGEDGGGWPSPYRLRCDAKRDAKQVCKWIGLPLFNVKASGDTVSVPV